MTALFIGNNRTEEMVGGPDLLTEEQRHASGYGGHRVVWFAREGDVIVLPFAPDPDYLDYVTDLTGVRPGSLRIVVPPPGRSGTGMLTADRLADKSFHAQLRSALGGRPLDEVFPMYPESSVVRLARALGAESAVPGHAFAGQGGSMLANSKAAFRALAAGAGVPVAPGAVAASLEEAVEAVTELLFAGEGGPVIVKKDFDSGAEGNEILSPAEGVRPIGARRVVVLPDAAAVQAHLAERWGWLSGDGRHRMVIERYLPDARALYAEFTIGDEGAVGTGHGEMRMTPVYSGNIIPAPGVPKDTLDEFIDAAARLCGVYRAIGYRGPAGVDGILTTDGSVLVSEINARVCGSTHLFRVVARRLACPDFLTERVISERSGLRAESFRAATALLDAAGLGYDPATRLGVVLICPMAESYRYLVIAEDGAGLEECDRLLAQAGAVR